MTKQEIQSKIDSFKKKLENQNLAEYHDDFRQGIADLEKKLENLGKATVDVVKPTKERKPRVAKPKSEQPKQTKNDVETAKAEIKRRTGKTEEECEKIIEEYRSLRTKSQERKKKEAEASKSNAERINKLKDDNKVIEGTTEKTADAVIETTTKEVAQKIEKQIDAIEQKAETEAKKEVEKEMPKVSATEKKKEVEKKVEEKVKEKAKTIVKTIVIDTSALLKSISESLGKFDKDSQKEFLIKLRSDIDKLLSKYGYGGMTSGATQIMNIQQSNLSSSSVNPTMFSEGGGVENAEYEVVNRNDKHYGEVGVSLHGWNIDNRGRYYCTLQFPNGSVSTYGEGEVSPYQHKGMRFTDGGKIEYNQYGVPQGYLYLSEFANFDRKGSGELKDVAVTILEDNFLEEQDYEGQQIHAYLHDLRYFVDYETEIPRNNPTSPVNDEPMTDNYLLLVPIEEGDEDLYNNGVYFRTYFVDTQGYDYPRYITRLENYFPSDEQVEELGYMKRGGKTRKLNHGGDIYDRYSMRSGDSINNKYGR
jgi:chemotaxis protein histidine kinase CheA